MPEQTFLSRVAWVDTDTGGRIHHTAAFRWAELAEVELMRGLGLIEEWKEGLLPRRNVQADFLGQLEFDDPVRVDLQVANVGRTSITYSWQISGESAVCIEGRHTCVHVGLDGRPRELPEHWRSLLAQP